MQVLLRVFLLVFGVVTSLVSYGQEQASDAVFVGSQMCIECHQKETEAWQGSDHERAMDHVSKESVLGDFNDVNIEFRGKTNRFFKRGEEFWVNIEGPDGQFHDYQIQYTFGYYPLQQYMVLFEDGRVQLIPFAWDSRSKDKGGQRWFHLYPDLTPNDEFYWTNAGQNWNFMCADCHSTNLQKNYNSTKNRYATAWSEINVGCEACHGPASYHVALSKQEANHQLTIEPHYGFDRDLSEAVSNWVFKEKSSTLLPEAVKERQQVKVCAQCHSRRVQLSEEHDHVQTELLDRYLLSNLTPELYHADGQIYDEVYVLGSFEQSKMAQSGVSCTNCHDPHSTKLKMPEESVCLQCHIASEYTSAKHTFHPVGSEADKCTTCHMPATTYMQIDPRRDHSWSIPRPDLSQHLGTPNVCTSCHEDKSDEWASKALSGWFPNSSYQNSQHFGFTFHASELGHRAAPDSLSYIAQDNQQPPIVRASALQKLAGQQGQNTLIAIGRAVRSEEAMIRVGAIKGSSAFSALERWELLSPLLDDPVLAVRSEAAGALVRYWAVLDVQQRKQLASALNDYIQVQHYNSDRGFGRTNLGNVYAAQGETEKAIKEYENAIDIEPYFERSYINLADLYRREGFESKAEETLSLGIKNQPDSAVIRYSAALSNFRQGNKSQASELLKQAVELDNTNSQYWYVYGLSLAEGDIAASLSALEQAYEIEKRPDFLYVRCELMIKHQLREASNCLDELAKVAPPEVIKTLKATKKK